MEKVLGGKILGGTDLRGERGEKILAGERGEQILGGKGKKISGGGEGGTDLRDGKGLGGKDLGGNRS